MLVPGWPQHYLGHSRRGRIFLWLYLVLLLLGLLSLGTTTAAVLLGLAVAVHVPAVSQMCCGVRWPTGGRAVVTSSCVRVSSDWLRIGQSCGVSRNMSVSGSCS